MDKPWPSHPPHRSRPEIRRLNQEARPLDGGGWGGVLKDSRSLKRAESGRPARGLRRAGKTDPFGGVRSAANTLVRARSRRSIDTVGLARGFEQIHCDASIAATPLQALEPVIRRGEITPKIAVCSMARRVNQRRNPAPKHIAGAAEMFVAVVIALFVPSPATARPATDLGERRCSTEGATCVGKRSSPDGTSHPPRIRTGRRAGERSCSHRTGVVTPRA